MTTSKLRFPDINDTWSRFAPRVPLVMVLSALVLMSTFSTRSVHAELQELEQPGVAEEPVEPAASPSPTVTSSETTNTHILVARQLYLQGRQLVESAGADVPESVWLAALELFRRSYRLYPTPLAVFSGALCQRNLGQLQEAAAGFEEYLQRYGTVVDDEQRRRGERELSELRSRLARLEVRVIGPELTELRLDGGRIGQESGVRGVYVMPGRHSVEARALGHIPVRREIQIGPGESTSLELTLTDAAGGLATVRFEVPLAEVSLTLDGQQVGTSPLIDPDFLTSVGNHIVEASRPGYDTFQTELTLRVGESQMVQVSLTPLTVIPENLAATLEVDVSERRAQILVDGLEYEGGPLPIGFHRVEVRREGFETWSEEVTLAPGQTLEIEAALTPNSAQENRRRRNMRLSGWVLGGLGLSLVTAWAGLFIWNRSRIDDYVAESRLLEDEDAPNREERLAAQRTLVMSIDSTGIASWTFLGVGVVLLSVATILLIAQRRRPTERALSFLSTVRGFALTEYWCTHREHVH